MNYIADAVIIDLAANAIRVQVPGLDMPAVAAREATLDVGANGRLIGLEIGDDYVTVMDVPHAQETYVRSAGIQVGISDDTPPMISIPRRGPMHEITYPSGNECWQMKSVGGELIQVCATIEGAPGALHGARANRSTATRRHSGGDREPGEQR